jgi:hypothetical protein
MPDRVAARALVTALLTLLTVAGIRAIGPPGDWARPAGHVLVTGGALEVVLAGLLTALRWRHRPAADTLAGRLHRIVTAAIAAAMIGTLIGIALDLYNTRPKLTSPYHPPVAHFGPQSRSHQARVTVSNSQIGFLVRDILIAILVLAIIAVVLRVLRNRGRARAAQVTDLTVEETADDDLARAVQSGRMALRELDDARAAIINCYVAMEQSLAEAGAARGAAETPDELLARAVDAGLISAGPAGLLTRMFYEARFSTHPMAMSQRDQAERALADLAAELPAGELR